MRDFFKVTRPYILAVVAGMVVVTSALVIGARPMSGTDSPVRALIPKGSTAGDASRILYETGLIRSPFIFKIACKLSGQSGKLKPGLYQLNKTMPMAKVIDTLVDGDSLESWVTIPEGFNAKQIADTLQEKKLADGAAFAQLAIAGGSKFRDYPFITGDNLEGYLFPDTYLISRDTNADGIVREMLKTFEKKVLSGSRLDMEKVITKRFGLDNDQFAEGLHKILTLASIVEREAKIPKDRLLIAGVLWNRLNKGMRLEVDDTIGYIPGQTTGNKKKVYYRDLAVDSPYNTYRRAGLPPAPICNPGLASIQAVLNPAEVDYLYYVAKPDGSHLFARTFEEHKKNRLIAQGGGK